MSEYRRRLIIVKRRGPTTAQALLLMVTGSCAVLAAPGCKATVRPSVRPYLIAVRYDVEPIAIGRDAAARRTRIETDLQIIRELSFDAVVFEHVEDERRAEAVELASSNGLAVFTPDREIEFLLSTGQWSGGASRMDEQLRQVLRGVARHEGLGGLSALHVPSSTEGRLRLDRVRRASDAAGVRLVTPADSPTEPRNGSAVALVDTSDLSEADAVSPLERLLAQFHRELSSGRTGGLVVDRFARAPGDRAGLSAVEDAPTAARRAAVQGLLGRARRWGPLIGGAPSTELNSVQKDSGFLCLTMYVSGRRRFVMAHNASADAYFRGPVTVAARQEDRAISRLVEIPATSAHTAGEVFEAQRGGVIVRLDLRPGDAALFEAF